MDLGRERDDQHQSHTAVNDIIGDDQHGTMTILLMTLCRGQVSPKNIAAMDVSPSGRHLSEASFGLVDVPKRAARVACGRLE